MAHGRSWTLGALAAAIAVTSLAAVTVSGQAGGGGIKGSPATAKAWTAPRGADGHPDLSGVWSHNSATPLERPLELAGRPLLTDQELAALKKAAAELFNGNGDAAFGDAVYTAALKNVLGKQKGFTSSDGTTGDYNSFWVVDREFDNRTSLITDPPDGRLPALTPEAQKRRADAAEHRRLHPFDGPEDIALSERCITGSVPMMGAGYNNYYQIAQTREYVAIGMEMRHDTRMIPLDGRPHVPGDLRFWLGDSRGRWEGDTLMVDTTNFRNDTTVGASGASPKTHVIERFTRVGPDTLKYQVTIDDPVTWTKPWTAELFMKRSKDQIYEYACHEGNEAMSGTLSGARVQEKKAESAGKTGSK
jgi:hypothetical protein